jgi:sporulation protein YlmC with PRC-barrel domain
MFLKQAKMKRSVNSLIGYAIGATNGELGKVKEFFFDDKTWTIRYLVVETGNWLSGRKVLISPEAVLIPDWENKIFPVNLTEEQVKNSPEIDTEKPVSRQQELKLYGHYPWTNYWGDDAFGLGMPVSMFQVMQNDKENADDNESDDDPHLRSTKNVTGYSVNATDGEIGNVEDFIIDDRNWKLDFVIVDTGKWFPGKKVIISPKWIKKIEWETSTLIVKVSAENVKNSPVYDPIKPISEDDESSLHSYYNGIISNR